MEAKALTVRLAADVAQALPLLARAERYAVAGETVTELAAGEAVFELLEGGRRVGAFTLGIHDTAAGRMVHCGAAGGLPGYDLVGTMVRFAEHEAARIGARRLVCETRRRGLVRRLARCGFAASYTLTKDLT